MLSISPGPDARQLQPSKSNMIKHYNSKIINVNVTVNFFRETLGT